MCFSVSLKPLPLGFEALQLLVFPAQRLSLRGDIDPGQGFGALGLQAQLRPTHCSTFSPGLSPPVGGGGHDTVRHRRLRHDLFQDLVNFVERAREALLARPDDACARFEADGNCAAAVRGCSASAVKVIKTTPAIGRSDFDLNTGLSLSYRLTAAAR